MADLRTLKMETGNVLLWAKGADFDPRS